LEKNDDVVRREVGVAVHSVVLDSEAIADGRLGKGVDSNGKFEKRDGGVNSGRRKDVWSGHDELAKTLTFGLEGRIGIGRLR
jgi:hypothetical protein